MDRDEIAMANHLFYERLSKLDLPTAEQVRKSLGDTRLKETIYMIESPSSEDLFKARNEGDALARTLALAEIEVNYYLAASEETFQDALDDIAIRINGLNDVYAMPFIHISAHGHEQGIELTDGGTVFWDQLTFKLSQLSELVGMIPPLYKGASSLPRINLGLSSCGAFANYKAALIGQQPVQLMLGPTRDVGWCQALIGFSTFYYQSFILEQNFHKALEVMNVAASANNEKLFQLHTVVDHVALATAGLDELIEYTKK